MQAITFLNFWLNYSDKNNYFERIFIAVKNIDHFIRKSDELRLLLPSDGARVDDNEYLESLENKTEVIVCTEEQMRKLSIYFDTRRYLHFKNITKL